MSELDAIRDDLVAADDALRLAILAELADSLPEFPARLIDDPRHTERVEECQSLVFVAIELTDEGRVRVHAAAPEHARATRGLAAVLVAGLSGLRPAEVVAVADDYPRSLGLERVVSPLRLAGMSGMLRRIKRRASLSDAHRSDA